MVEQVEAPAPGHIVQFVETAERIMADQLPDLVDDSSNDGDLVNAVQTLVTLIRALEGPVSGRVGWRFIAVGERVDKLKVRSGAVLTLLQDRLCGIAEDLGLDESPLFRLGCGNFGDDETDRLLEKMRRRCDRRDGTSPPIDPDALLAIEWAWNEINKKKLEVKPLPSEPVKNGGISAPKLAPRYETAMLAIGWARKARPDLVGDDGEVEVTDQLYELLKEECPLYRSEDDKDSGKPKLPNKKSFGRYLRAVKEASEGPRITAVARDHGSSVAKVGRI